MTRDAGYFGPDSVSWRVHREVTVLFGGARAVLMQAAHPLVIAGARETGFYERNPWKRLQRTLMLTYAITFGSKAEAHAAADRINEVHARIKGVDPVTGLAYDALDPQLLLWVHACLVDSALLFEALTVGRLDGAGRQRFHEEQMLAAELVRLPRERVPATVLGLEAYVADTVASGELFVTDAARSVAELFLEAGEERDHLVLDRLLDGEDPGDVDPGGANPVQCRLGDPALPRVGLADGDFDLEPRAVLRLLAPDPFHRRARVPIDHEALTLAKNATDW